MRIWLYSIIRNEERILPYFLRHYTQFVDKLIFYDGKSNDRTHEIVLACQKAELRWWPGEDGIVDDQFLDFANEQWKEARGKAEWVIWVDADEFVYHPNILEVLERYLKAGVDLPQITGYTMVSDHFPTTAGQIYDEIKTGFYDDVWSKPAVFRTNMKWTMGRHNYDRRETATKASEHPELKLLHYRCLGMDYLINRHRRNWERVPERCRRMNLGTNCAPWWNDHHGVSWFEEISKRKLENVI